MKNRTLDGQPVSEVGLGAWQLGADWGTIRDARAAEILSAADAAGVTFIDTADVYGAGRSETRIGAFYAGRAERPLIATKLGRLHGYPDGYSLALFRRCCRDSARRLGVSSLDLVQLHCVPTATLQDGAVFRWLRTLRDEGLIQRFGASVESTEEARICLAQPGLSSLQVIFNVFRQRPIADIFDEAAEKKVALIVRLPLASGLLSGRLTADSTFPEDDHRHYNRDGAAFHVGETFNGIPLSAGIPLVTGLRDMLPAGRPLAQLALRFILDHPAVTVVIPGASRPQQVTDNAAASDLPALSGALHQRLSRYFDTQVAHHIRGQR